MAGIEAESEEGVGEGERVRYRQTKKRQRIDIPSLVKSAKNKCFLTTICTLPFSREPLSLSEICNIYIVRTVFTEKYA